MKPLAIWLAVFAVLFGVLALVTTALRETTRVFVVMDTSFGMAAVWNEALDELDRIDNRDRAEFALATEKDFVHSWQSELRLGTVDPFAPCTFDAIESYPEAGEADELILITTAASCDSALFTDWEIILVGG